MKRRRRWLVGLLAARRHLSMLLVRRRGAWWVAPAVVLASVGALPVEPSPARALSRRMRQLRLATLSRANAVPPPMTTRSHVGLCRNASTSIQSSATAGSGSTVQRRT